MFETASVEHSTVITGVRVFFSSPCVTLSKVGLLYAPLYALMQENKIISNLYKGVLIMMKQKLSPVKYETAFVPLK